MHENYYRDKIVKEYLLSSVYKEVSVDSDKIVFKILKGDVKKSESILTKKEIDYLINFKFTSSHFCCSPKVHKSEIIKNVINTVNSLSIEVHCSNYLKAKPLFGVPESQHND